jgi:hypothetical protein
MQKSMGTLSGERFATRTTPGVMPPSDAPTVPPSLSPPELEDEVLELEEVTMPDDEVLELDVAAPLELELLDESVPLLVEDDEVELAEPEVDELELELVVCGPASPVNMVQSCRRQTPPGPSGTWQSKSVTH